MPISKTPRTKTRPVALPARMTFRHEGLHDLQVHMLSFPFQEAINEFLDGLKDALGEKDRRNSPMRRVSNLLLASSPALAHGFEFYGRKGSPLPGYYALCVAAPNAPFVPPAIDLILDAIQICIKDWIEPFYEKSPHIGTLCNKLLDSLHPPVDWGWQSTDAQELVDHVDRCGSLAYNVLPALLATLMHGTTSVLKQGQHEREITWRRVQGDGSDRTGVFVVSCPFRASYKAVGEKTKEGYFAYRLDFRVQTQVGRWNESGDLKPWVFLDVSCQRYAHETLVGKNAKRDVSVLVGTRQERTKGFGVDPAPISTLVRLKLHRNRDGYVWESSKYDSEAVLSRLLEAMNARALLQPQSLLDAPQKFGRFPNEADFATDEYYIVHAEGLKYGKGKGANHTISTGFSFKERGEIVARVLDQLKGVLEPDKPLETDENAPSGSKTPAAMRSFGFFEGRFPIPAKEQERLKACGELEAHLSARRLKSQPTIHAALARVMHGEPLHVMIAALDPTFRAEMRQALRDIWLLGSDDSWPHGVTVQDASIEENDASLWEKFDAAGLKPGDKNFVSTVRQQEPAKRRVWREFLERQLKGEPHGAHRFAFIALEEPEPGLSIKGAVRAACTNLDTASQMIVKSNRSDTTKTDGQPLSDWTKKRLAAAKKGRLNNAALDLVMRQTGALYGVPSKIYERAGLKEVADSLDVVALCRYKTSRENVYYALSLRLSSEGLVDVLLPGGDEWIPYHQAGPRVGKIFIAGRSAKPKDKSNPIYLKNHELAAFAAHVFAHLRERPTLAVIEADGWRNEGLWPQLKNSSLGHQLDVLNFNGASQSLFNRDEHLPQLLGIVRIRDDAETPQYITRGQWEEDADMRDFGALSGFIDSSVPHIPHYFSAARLPDTQQDNKATRDLYKLDSSSHPEKPQFVDYGADIAFKHPQIIEMLPFFVRRDFAHDRGMCLCRALHYLRLSPAWSMGNILSPYPMHLGRKLIEDQCCIVGEEESGDGA